MNRRVFVSLAAGAAARAYDKSPVGIGFLGASHSHAEGKLSALRAVADMHLVGVCEPDPKLQEKLRGQGISLLSREKLLKHPGIQVIVTVRNCLRKTRASYSGYEN